MAHINLQIIKIFIVHYKKLVNRKSHIIRELNTHNIMNYEFIQIDRDELSGEDCNNFEGSITFNKPGMAIALSHFHAYKEIADKYDHALIIEDDVILSNNFTETLTKYLTQLPEEYDMLFLGDGCKFHIHPDMLVPRKYIYERGVDPTEWGGNGATRCCDSYIVNKKCAIKLTEYLSTLKTKISEIGIDWWLNNLARHYQFKVYWAEPTIVTQGSQNGLFSQTSS